MSQRAKPDAAFALALRTKLEQQGYLPAARHSTVMAWKAGFASVTVLTSCFAGTIGYAYASDAVLPNHPLYPIREQIERVQLKLAQTPSQQETLRLQLLQRRVKEFRLLKKNQQPLPEKQLARVSKNIEKTVTIIQQKQSNNHSDIESRSLIAMNGQEFADLVNERNQADNDDEKNVLDDLVIDQADQLRQELTTLKDQQAHEQVLRPATEASVEEAQDTQGQPQDAATE